MTAGDRPIHLSKKGYSARRARRRRGLTLIESAMALGLFALAAGFAVQQVAEYMDNVKARTVAGKMLEVSEASQGYIKQNFPALMDKMAVNQVITIPVGRPNATTAPPAGPLGLDSIQGAGFLPSSFIDVNGYGQRHALLVRKVDANHVEAMITTYGGRTIADASLAKIGTFVGNTGGYVLAAPPKPADANMVIGSYGGYRTSTANWAVGATAPASGHFQSSLVFQDGTLVADYLYRNDIGVPEANTMNTSINMQSATGKNSINNAKELNGESVNASIDVWAKGNVKADKNVSAGLDVTAGRDVLAVRDVSSGRNVTATDSMTAGANVKAGGNLIAGTDATIGRDASVARNLSVNGDASISYMNLNDTIVYDGSRFSKTGKVKLIDLLPRQVAQYSYLVRDGGTVFKPTCGGDFSKARVFVYRQVDSVKTPPIANFALNLSRDTSGYLVNAVIDNTNSYVNVADGIVATSNQFSWTVRWIGGAAADGAARQAIAQTYCYYG